MIQVPTSDSLGPLPHNATILGRLRERGVSLSLLPGETRELGRARLETALMALFRDGREEAAFAALYEFAHAELASWVELLLSGAGRMRGLIDPAELVQDTLVNVYRYAESFRDEHARSFRVWTHTIATNLLRRSCIRRERTSLQALPEGVCEPRDPRGTPTEELVRGEDQRSVLAAWMIVLSQYAEAYEQLSPRDRQALDMIEVQGLSYAAACKRLSVGLSNMKMILFRARRRIRARIAERLESAGSPRAALAG
ncbi:MAG: RNA polymerase sigma factor [Planctomycetes bacterium]|nr:RNA polymerase sigma factor [Planctomycetota bacterium]